MNEFFKWYKPDEFPELIESDYEYCKESIPVLGLYKDGTQAVIRCSQYHYDWEDEPEKIRRQTNCSESWYIDIDDLIAWCYLPSTDEFKEILQIGVKNEDCL